MFTEPSGTCSCGIPVPSQARDMQDLMSFPAGRHWPGVCGTVFTDLISPAGVQHVPSLDNGQIIELNDLSHLNR